MTDVIVTIQDTRELRYCRRGACKFFTDRGLDWHDFLRNGIPASTLEQFDDEMVREAIANAKKRVEGDAA